MNPIKQPKNRLVWAIAFFLVIIGVVIVMRRFLFLVPVLENRYQPTSPAPGLPSFPEDEFARNPLLTLVHILPGFLFVVFGLLQFAKRIRVRWPHVHRWSGRIVLASGILIGITGIIMGFKMPISGVSLTSATTLFGAFFLFSLAKGFLHIRRQETTLHRQWMIRAFAIGLAVTTTRPIMGVFFATSPLTGLTVEDFFGTALWIGFTIHLIAAEAWINHTR